MRVSALFSSSVLVSAAASILFACAANATPSLTEGILDSYQGEAGLCIVLGVGEAEEAALTAELAASGRLVVHGIALNDEALASARSAIQAAGVEGLASVEKLPVAPLPYRDNLANLVVLANPALLDEAGLTDAEAKRILAPGGSLCTVAQGKPSLFVKPWPPEMDQWTHESHGPDGNCVSEDQLVHFPVGYRWHGGLPMNLQNPQQTANAWSSTRGMAVADGHCYTLSNSVLDNLGPTYRHAHGVDQFVTARDAFNGLFLWRRNIGATYYGGLFYPNRAPLVAVDGRVYVASADGKLLMLDGATGETSDEIQTTYIPGVILVDRGILVAATWKDGSRVGGVSGVDRRRMTFALSEGTVEAFDAKKGRRLWIRDGLATSLLSDGESVYLLQRSGADLREEQSRKRRGEDEAEPERPSQSVVAVALESGQARWTVGAEILGSEDPLRMDAVGLGVVTVTHDNGAKTTALRTKDGSLLFQANANSYTAFYDDAVQLGALRYDPKTGEQIGRSEFSLGKTICTPRYFANNIVVANRGCGFIVDGKSTSYRGARGGCLFASIPAYGEFYTPQNWCRCAPSQIQGFVSFGPIASEPTAEEMEAPPLVERGPAWGKLKMDGQIEGDWPLFRQGSDRGNAASCRVPVQLSCLWTQRFSWPSPNARIEMNWRERLTGVLTAPTVADGIAYVAATDRHQVLAIDARDGHELWRRTVGGRVDTPPTIFGDGCFVAARDGYVYALDRLDGQVAWRMRVAPREERMVSYGQVESPWPVKGGVLIADGIAYASAGRSQGSDGGIVVRAFEPPTGKVLWSRAVSGIRDTRSMRLNDLIVMVDGELQVMNTRLDAQTGEILPNPTNEYQKLRRPEEREGKSVNEIVPTIGLEGFTCGNWTRLGNRKSMTMGFGNAQGDLVSWGEETVAVYQFSSGVVQAVRRSGVGSVSEPLSNEARLWSIRLPLERQVTSIVASPNAIVIGGGDYTEDQEHGFVQVLSLEDGTTQAAEVLESPLSYNGLAVADQAVFATLTDGTTVRLGAGGER